MEEDALAQAVAKEELEGFDYDKIPYKCEKKAKKYVNKRLKEHKYLPRIRTCSQGSMLVNQMKEKTFVHKVIALS
jgi:hypothetical protein